MARKKSTADLEHDEPDADDRQPISKVDAVRAVLGEGVAKPQEGVAVIKGRYGIDLNPQHFSAIKSQLKKKEGEGATKGGPGREPRAAEGERVHPRRQGAGDQAELLAAMEAMKPLVDSLGADKVKRIVDLLK